MKQEDLIKYVNDLGVPITSLVVGPSGLASGSYIAFDDSGKKYFIKTLFEDSWPVSKSEKETYQKYEKDIFVSKYRLPREDRRGDAIIRLEAEVLKNWNTNGISAPKLIATDNSNVSVLSYLEGTSFLQSLRSDINSELDDLIVYEVNKMRSIAKKNQDPYLLHNDLQPANIFYSDNSVYLIDPGLEFNKNLSFKELDAHLNLFFAYSVIGGYFLPPSTLKERRSDFLDSFISSIDNETKSQMAKCNIITPKEYINQLHDNSKHLSDMENYSWWSQFNEYNYSKIQNLLE